MWAHDFAPAFDTASGDVGRCIVVGVPNEATPATLKFTLGAAILFVDRAAVAAAPGDEPPGRSEGEAEGGEAGTGDDATRNASPVGADGVPSSTITRPLT